MDYGIIFLSVFLILGLFEIGYKFIKRGLGRD